MMLGAVGVVEPPIGGFRPAGCFENAGGERSDVTRQSFPRARGDEVKARAGPTRPRIDDEHEPPDAALAILFGQAGDLRVRSEEHTSELQSRRDLVCRLLLE